MKAAIRLIMRSALLFDAFGDDGNDARADAVEVVRRFAQNGLAAKPAEHIAQQEQVDAGVGLIHADLKKRVEQPVHVLLRFPVAAFAVGAAAGGQILADERDQLLVPEERFKDAVEHENQAVGR